MARLAFLILAAACSDRSSQPPVVQSDHPSAQPSKEGGRVIGRAPTGEGIPSIVTLEPRAAAPLPPTETAVMDQIALTFAPGLLVVRTGGPVVFRNSDTQIHNINVKLAATQEQTFNVAVPMGGAYRYSFQADGFYIVRCDIHAAMAASIVSTSTPFSAITDTEGRFVIENVPAGSYRAVVFVGPKRLDRDVEVGANSTEINLEADSRLTSSLQP